mgnify:CR=1 FL=1
MDYSIRDILDRKRGELHAVRPDDTISTAVKVMNAHNVGAVVVTEGEVLEGIFTERDVLRRVVDGGVDPAITPVSDLMSTELVFIRPENTVSEAMVILDAKGIRHLPVIDNGQIVGLVSMRDLINQVVDGQEHEISELVQYISGAYGPGIRVGSSAAV